MEQLNAQQQKMVEDNHKLIYSLAHKKNINLDEFYGDLAVGLCKAALIYDPSKGAFSTLAYTTMYNEYMMRLREKTSERTIPQDKILSLEYEMQSVDAEGVLTYANLLPDETVHIEEDTVAKFTYKQLTKRLRAEERMILDMLMNGLSQVEIASHFGHSRQWVNVKVKNIRTKLKQEDNQ